jgi:hypothetical protein
LSFFFGAFLVVCVCVSFFPVKSGFFFSRYLQNI